MDSLEIIEHLTLVALGGVWSIMASAWVGYWLPPIVGAVLGWFRNGKYPTWKRVWISLVNALAAVAIAFVLVFTYEFVGACWHFWNPQQVLVQSARPVSPASIESPVTKQYLEDRQSLKRRTEFLAQDLYDWSITRDVERNSVKQQAIAQAFVSSMKGEKNGAEQFRGRLATWENETMNQFLSLYWPRVVALQDELHTAGVDTSPISRAESVGNPERIALMFSVVAERIGRRPPFPRQITPLQVKAITRDIGSLDVEIYADLQDDNSRQIAETLRKGFSVQKGMSVNRSVFPIKSRVPQPRGIWVIYPSADMATELNSFIPLLDSCELENRWEIRPIMQPPTIVKIEVWPSTPNWEPPTGPNLVR
jgi:hypothetical protein